jgi:hypothetical protein
MKLSCALPFAEFCSRLICINDVQDCGPGGRSRRVTSTPCAVGAGWLHGCLKEGKWHGAGDETRLEQIITIFLAWAEG